MTTKYFHTVVEAALRRLEDEIFNTEGPPLVDLEVAMESLDGDASHLPELALAIGDKIAVGEPLTTLERYWLALVLHRIAANVETARAISGKIGRGAPKRGARSLDVAQDVLSHILLDVESTTIKVAWEKVALRHHLSVDTVREYWASRKVTVCCSQEESLGLDCEEDVEIDDAIDRVLKAKREKPGISPSGGK